MDAVIIFLVNKYKYLLKNMINSIPVSLDESTMNYKGKPYEPIIDMIDNILFRILCPYEINRTHCAQRIHDCIHDYIYELYIDLFNDNTNISKKNINFLEYGSIVKFKSIFLMNESCWDNIIRSFIKKNKKKLVKLSLLVYDNFNLNQNVQFFKEKREIFDQSSYLSKLSENFFSFFIGYDFDKCYNVHTFISNYSKLYLLYSELSKYIENDDIIMIVISKIDILNEDVEDVEEDVDNDDKSDLIPNTKEEIQYCTKEDIQYIIKEEIGTKLKDIQSFIEALQLQKIEMETELKEFIYLYEIEMDTKLKEFQSLKEINMEIRMETNLKLILYLYEIEMETKLKEFQSLTEREILSSISVLFPLFTVTEEIQSFQYYTKKEMESKLKEFQSLTDKEFQSLTEKEFQSLTEKEIETKLKEFQYYTKKEMETKMKYLKEFQSLMQSLIQNIQIIKIEMETKLKEIEEIQSFTKEEIESFTKEEIESFTKKQFQYLIQSSYIIDTTKKEIKEMKEMGDIQFFQILETKMATKMFTKIKEMKEIRDIHFFQYLQILKKIVTKKKNIEKWQQNCISEEIQYCISEEIQSLFYNIYAPIKSSFTKFNILLNNKFNTV
jgi:hypothetical protein